MADDFDRIKPPDRKLLDRPSTPSGEDADPDGRGALFSAGPRGTRQPVSAGLTSHCSRCGGDAALDPTTILRAALPLFLVAPWKDHPVFAVCPVCRTRSWLRVEG